VITSFIESWDLFQHTYMAGWLIALLLSLVGVLVVARDQIFIGMAVSQASTLGIAVGLQLSSLIGLSWFASDGFLSLLAVTFAILAALLTARGGKTGQESHEAITGWVFLLSASLSILLVAHSPHGLVEVQRLLSSSIIGATSTDVWTIGTLAILTTVAVGVGHRHVLLCVLDPDMATAIGIRVSLWTVGIAVWLGLLIGLSMRVSGMLFTFGCLVLPALVAKNLCREVRTVFLIAPLVAIASAAVGFVFANYYDYPPAQMTVAVLCLLQILAWLCRRRLLGEIGSQKSGVASRTQTTS
jgi:ABC-type Mn2+/Zn2+ transport system permease subunit